MWEISLILGITICFVVLFRLIIITKKSSRFIPLLVFVVLLLVELSVQLVIDSDLLSQIPHLIYLTEPVGLLYGLLIFIYARSFNQDELKISKFDLLFFTPFILSLLAYIPFYLLEPQDKVSDLLNYGGLKYDVTENIWEWLFEITVNISFLIAALKEILKYNNRIKEQFSSIQNSDLHLSVLFIKVFIIFYLAELFFVYLTFYGFPYYNELYEAFYLIKISSLVLVGIDAVKSFNQLNKIQQGLVRLTEPVSVATEQKTKYAKSALKGVDSKNIKEELLSFMQNNKPYLEPELRIRDLAELTKIPAHHISQVLNEELSQNFHEFINSYRVEESKKILKNKDSINLTLTAIGFDAGFNSKSAFYNAFKKATGETPAQFRSGE